MCAYLLKIFIKMCGKSRHLNEPVSFMGNWASIGTYCICLLKLIYNSMEEADDKVYIMGIFWTITIGQYG